MAIVAYYGQKVAGVWYVTVHIWYVTVHVCDVKCIDLHIFDPFVAERGFNNVWIVIESVLNVEVIIFLDV
jgi:hypothetical protein